MCVLLNKKYVLLSEGIDDFEEKTSVGRFVKNIPDFNLFKLQFWYCFLSIIYLIDREKTCLFFSENEQEIIHV